jgi:cyclopropane fatty-acyl-phospholipid synthase-like methyltransferase
MAEHFRDFLNPDIDPYAERVLRPESDFTHRALLKTGPRILNALGAELVCEEGRVQHWDFNNGPNRSVMEIERPDIVIPAMLRYGDVGLFYTRTAEDIPLWAPNVRATSVPADVDTGNPEVDCLVPLLEDLYVSASPQRQLGRVAAKFAAPVRDSLARMRWSVSTGRTKGEIAAHYDLTQEVYTGDHGFLDDEFVQYSSGLLPPGHEFESLGDLQAHKVDALAGKLQLDTARNLLEVGGGWGGLAVALAERAPHLKITSLTISDEQLKRARQRAEDAGVSDRVQFVGKDYRDLDADQSFDRVVSVEMIEAVDWRDLDTYFDALAGFVNPHIGVIALQSINIKPEHYAQHRHNKSFANTAIFPGGALAPKETIIDKMADRGWSLHEETDLTSSYALTLREWIRNFCENEPELTAKWLEAGVPSSQIRRFQDGFKFYLAACQAGFRPVTQNIQCWQTAFRPA